MPTAAKHANAPAYVTVTVPSPVGPLRLVATDRALVGVWFEHHVAPREQPASPSPDHPVLQQAAEELRAWFAGERRTFSVPTEAEGTEFQRAVWAALAEIPFGEQRSYTDIAVRVGRPGAVRAVGSANARNPLSIVVPCHRVTGRDGSLTGYAGGVDAKAWLLAHEGSSFAGDGPRLFSRSA